jgi:two-component system alkaline phosphatase synthesis response regulator PhoP
VAHAIWIVDDEPLFRAAVIAVLEAAGYEPRGFERAEQMYSALVDGDLPDLLILDHLLPDENGSLIVHALRERAEFRDIPILFLTGVGVDEAERLTDLAPVLRKPFDFRDFIAIVQTRLAEAAAAEEGSATGEALGEGSAE